MEILKYINQDFIIKGQLYDEQHLPASIGNAIYSFGSNDIDTIRAFIDTSDYQDGSQGMIFTDTHVYYLFDEAVRIAYKDIKELVLKKNRNFYQLTIKENNEYIFNQAPIHIEKMAYLLSKITDLDITMDLSLHEKIAYYVPYVIKDIEEDNYEDVELTDNQNKVIKELKEEFMTIEGLDDENYQYELEQLCLRAVPFFDELELDSEEIDELIEVYKQLEEKNNKEEEMFDTAQRYYDDMMKNYRNGDTAMFDNVNKVMNNFGMDFNDLNNKSPEELNAYIDDVCDKFHISRSQLEKVAQKFKK
jgi:biopolymer transport protein ExbD